MLTMYVLAVLVPYEAVKKFPQSRGAKDRLEINDFLEAVLLHGGIAAIKAVVVALILGYSISLAVGPDKSSPLYNWGLGSIHQQMPL